MKEFIELMEMIIGDAPQNKFIGLINRLCTIKPGDSEEEIEEKRQRMTFLIMIRVKAVVMKKAESDPTFAKKFEDAKSAVEKVKMEQENDDLDRMVKELLKKKDQ